MDQPRCVGRAHIAADPAAGLTDEAVRAYVHRVPPLQDPPRSGFRRKPPAHPTGKLLKRQIRDRHAAASRFGIK
jgi:hypothetical protein